MMIQDRICSVSSLLFYIITFHCTWAGPVIRPSRMVREIYPEVEQEIPDSTPSQACIVSGVVYATGAAVPGAAPCERCVCARGRVSCSARACACAVAGRSVPSGQRLPPRPGAPCHVCYCRSGHVRCAEVGCYTRQDCQPRYLPDECCPKYDHCPPREPLSDRAEPVLAPLNASDLVTFSIREIESKAGSRRGAGQPLPPPAARPQITIQEVLPPRTEFVPSAKHQAQDVMLSTESSNELSDVESYASEKTEVYEQPPPVLRIGDQLLFVRQGQLVPEKDASTPSPVITLIGAEGLQIGLGSGELLEHDLLPTSGKTEDTTEVETATDEASNEFITVNESSTVASVSSTVEAEQSEYIPEENPYYPPIPEDIMNLGQDEITTNVVIKPDATASTTAVKISKKPDSFSSSDEISKKPDLSLVSPVPSDDIPISQKTDGFTSFDEITVSPAVRISKKPDLSVVSIVPSDIPINVNLKTDGFISSDEVTVSPTVNISKKPDLPLVSSVPSDSSDKSDDIPIRVSLKTDSFTSSDEITASKIPDLSSVSSSTSDETTDASNKPDSSGSSSSDEITVIPLNTKPVQEKILPEILELRINNTLTLNKTVASQEWLKKQEPTKISIPLINEKAALPDELLQMTAASDTTIFPSTLSDEVGNTENYKSDKIVASPDEIPPGNQKSKETLELNEELFESGEFTTITPVHSSLLSSNEDASVELIQNDSTIDTSDLVEMIPGFERVTEKHHEEELKTVDEMSPKNDVEIINIMDDETSHVQIKDFHEEIQKRDVVKKVLKDTFENPKENIQTDLTEDTEDTTDSSLEISDQNNEQNLVKPIHEIPAKSININVQTSTEIIEKLNTDATQKVQESKETLGVLKDFFKTQFRQYHNPKLAD